MQSKEITNIDAQAYLAALTDVSNLDQKLPVKVGFKIMKNIHELRNHVQTYDEERSRIISQYARDGKIINKKDDPEIFEAVTEKLDELARIKIEVKITELEPEEAEYLVVPMKQMFALMFITKEAENAKSNG